MSNNIKVSDVFNLPLVVNKPVTETRGGWPIVSASLVGKSISGQIATLTISHGQHSGASKYLDVDLAFKMAQIGAESINNHDRLVEENAKLRDALAELVETSDMNEAQLSQELLEFHEDSAALSRAKKLLSELGESK